MAKPIKPVRAVKAAKPVRSLAGGEGADAGAGKNIRYPKIVSAIRSGRVDGRGPLASGERHLGKQGPAAQGDVFPTCGLPGGTVPTRSAHDCAHMVKAMGEDGRERFVRIDAEGAGLSKAVPRRYAPGMLDGQGRSIDAQADDQYERERRLAAWGVDGYGDVDRAFEVAAALERRMDDQSRRMYLRGWNGRRKSDGSGK